MGGVGGLIMGADSWIEGISASSPWIGRALGVVSGVSISVVEKVKEGTERTGAPASPLSCSSSLPVFLSEPARAVVLPFVSAALSDADPPGAHLKTRATARRALVRADEYAMP